MAALHMTAGLLHLPCYVSLIVIEYFAVRICSTAVCQQLDKKWQEELVLVHR